MLGTGLSRREREMLDILHRLGKASVQEVCDQMESAPSYSSVRSTLGILVDKGIAKSEEDGKRYLYSAAESSQEAAKSAVNKLVDTFFGGRLEGVVRTFLSDKESKISDEELDQLAKLIEASKSGDKK
jgi:predicted transcriptional regulator